MAAEFLRGHGIDLDAELARLQSNDTTNQTLSKPQTQNSDIRTVVRNASLPHCESGTTWDVYFSEDGTIARVALHDAQEHPTAAAGTTSPSPSTRSSAPKKTIDAQTALLAPSLCHPHIHLDKAYLLSHPSHAHLQIRDGDFKEAMSLTSQAKSKFAHADLLERGQRLIDESVAAGVTHMRAFVELDAGVGTKCLEAGVALKRRAESEGKCMVQLCAFAQLPVFSASEGDEDGRVIRGLMRDAAGRAEVDVLGSTPYVEDAGEKMERDVEWLVELAIESRKHIDFHLDYNLDVETPPLVWHVIEVLQRQQWTERNEGKTIVLGHCTRLALFSDDEWRRLASKISDARLPISFVGLPTSDLFMMRTKQQPEVRGTLNVPRLIKGFGLNACIGVNNIGNAFTPQGSCDPVLLACQGVGVYQSGTEDDAEILFECVSVRARAAIGLAKNEESGGLRVEEGRQANLVLFGSEDGGGWRTRKKVSEAVYLYDSCKGRRAFLRGALTAE